MTDQLLSLAREVGALITPTRIPVEGEAMTYAVTFMQADYLTAFAERIRQDERERCAAVCEAEGVGHRMAFGEHCAAAIRSSGTSGRKSDE